MDPPVILVFLLISGCCIIQQINATSVSSKNARSQVNGLERVDEENTNTCTMINTSGTFSVEYGSCIILNCLFDEVVQDCVWMSHTVVVINHRYTYTGKNSGTNSHDCTIKIDDFQIIDEANWRCTSMETFNVTSKNGPAMLLSGIPKRPQIEFNKRNRVINCSTETKYKSPNQLYWVIDRQKTPAENKMQIETTGTYKKITLNLNNNEDKFISCVAQYNDGTSLTSDTFIQRSSPAHVADESGTITAVEVSLIIGVFLLLAVFLYCHRHTVIPFVSRRVQDMSLLLNALHRRRPLSCKPPNDQNNEEVRHNQETVQFLAGDNPPPPENNAAPQ